MNQNKQSRSLQFIQCPSDANDNGFTFKQLRRTSPDNLDQSKLPVPEGKHLKYGCTEQQYLRSGRFDSDLIRSSLAKQGVDVQNGPGNILEFGCANARVLRWFSDWSSNGEAWGVDLDAPMILWCHQNLSPPFHFAVSTSAPHLFFEDRFFSLTFCMSIFTHIDDLFLSWIAELRRITAIGGFVYLTINDENAREIQGKRKAPALKIRQRNETFQSFIENEADFCTCGRDTKSLVSVRRSYFIDHVSRYFEVVQIIEGAMANAQTALLLKRI